MNYPRPKGPDDFSHLLVGDLDRPMIEELQSVWPAAYLALRDFMVAIDHDQVSPEEQGEVFEYRLFDLVAEHQLQEPSC